MTTEESLDRRIDCGSTFSPPQVHPGPDVIDPEEVETLYDTMIRSGAWMGADCDSPVTPDA